VLGGEQNIASGFFSSASGRGARTQDTLSPATPHNGTFVWADAGDPLNPLVGNFHSSASNQFAVRARGGIVFKANVATSADDATPGCSLPAGGAPTWSCTSDRNTKEVLATVSPQDVLSKVLSIPMMTWSYKGVNRKHLSPMAQDFWNAFGLGVDDKQITSSDVSGVALVAIQGLHAIVNDRNAQITTLKKENDQMRRDLARIKKKLGL
jgi:trimeric autotransporter adhesin